MPEADRLADTPHPRHTKTLFGQSAAQAKFLEAFNADRLHHAWLISGPRGVGKATLAWRIARFLLTTSSQPDGMFAPSEHSQKTQTLDVPLDHPTSRRIDAMTEGGLKLIRRAWDPKTEKLRQDIGVDDVRGLKSFFGLSATDGGRRVVIIDTIDQMTNAAANALLKVLEEPPNDAILLIVCHQPSRLLPTIRSRCRMLGCVPLGSADLQTAVNQATDATDPPNSTVLELAQGAVGQACWLAQSGGAQTYSNICSLFAGAPGFDRTKAIALAESCAGKANRESYDQLLTLMALFAARLAKTSAGSPPKAEAVQGEFGLFSRLAPTTMASRKWAEGAQEILARAHAARRVNLDPATVILDMFLKFDAVAQDCVQREALP